MGPYFIKAEELKKNSTAQKISNTVFSCFIDLYLFITIINMMITEKIQVTNIFSCNL